MRNCNSTCNGCTYHLGILFVGTRAFGEGDSYIAAGIGAVFGALLGASPIYTNFLPIFKVLVAILLLSVVVQLIITLPIFFKKLFVNKSWKTLGSLGAFILYTIGFVCAQNAHLLGSNIVYWLCTIILIALGIYACKELLCGLKENKAADGLYLPFRPAMIVAGFIALFTIGF